MTNESGCESINCSDDEVVVQGVNNLQQEGKLKEVLTIYPNPSNGIFTVELLTPETFKSLKLIDAKGAEVVEYTKNEIDIANPKIEVALMKSWTYTVLFESLSN